MNSRCSSSAHEEGVHAQSPSESDNGHDGASDEYGEGVAAQRLAEPNAYQRRRPRRSAIDRRAQRLRAEARCVSRLLAGFDPIATHRGNTLSNVGRALRHVLLAPTSSGGASVRQNLPLCRHWARNKCAYGNACNFSHDGPGGSYYCNGYGNGDGHGEDDVNNGYTPDGNGDSSEDDDTEHVAHESTNNEADEQPQHDVDNYEHEDTPHNQEEHNHKQHSNDDIDNIIDVINALTDDESQQMAMEAFPQHLLHEVLERLEQQQADYDSDHTHGSYQNHDLSDDDEVRKQENTSDEEMALQHLADARTQLHCNLKNLEQAVNEYQNQFGHHVDSDGCSSSHDDTEDVLPRLYYPDTNTYDSSIVSLNSLYRQGPAYDITEYVRLHPSDAQDKPLSKQSNIDDHWQTQLKSVNASVDDQNTDATQTRMQTFAELDSTAARSVPANGTNSRSDGDSDSWNYNGDFNAIISLLSDLPVYRMRAALKSMPPIQGVDPHLLQAIIELKFGTTPLSLDHDEDSRSDQSVPSEYEGDGE